MNPQQIDQLSAEQTQIYTSLFQTLYSFDEQSFNQVPFTGSWTPAQVAEHILRFSSGTLKTIYAGTQATERKPDEQVNALKKLFLNLDLKMPAPEFVVPGNEPIAREKLLADLNNISEKMDKVIHTADLSATCTLYQLPGFELMTRMEWIYFILYHTQRHIRQLENIHLSIAP